MCREYYLHNRCHIATEEMSQPPNKQTLQQKRSPKIVKHHSRSNLPVSKIDKTCITWSKQWFDFLPTFLYAIPVKIGILIKFPFSSCHFSLQNKMTQFEMRICNKMSTGYKRISHIEHASAWIAIRKQIIIHFLLSLSEFLTYF